MEMTNNPPSPRCYGVQVELRNGIYNRPTAKHRRLLSAVGLAQLHDRLTEAIQSN